VRDPTQKGLPGRDCGFAELPLPPARHLRARPLSPTMAPPRTACEPQLPYGGGTPPGITTILTILSSLSVKRTAKSRS
jgi:hypothetical protein